jgi:uncharacterized membrane protein
MSQDHLVTQEKGTMPSRARFKTFLLISLVINVFLIGTIVGGAYRWTAARKAETITQQRGLRFAAAELPEARKLQFREALRMNRRANRPLVEEARDGRLDVIAALSAPSFDPAALNAALAHTRQTDSALRASIESTVADFAGTLTPEERLKMVDAMQRHGPLNVGKPVVNKPGVKARD